MTWVSVSSTDFPLGFVRFPLLHYSFSHTLHHALCAVSVHASKKLQYRQKDDYSVIIGTTSDFSDLPATDSHDTMTKSSSSD